MDFGAIAVFFAVLSLSALSYLRRFPGFVETPYWYLSYASGFIRRGLTGTLVSPFILDRPLQDGVAFVAALCTGIAAVYLAVLAILAALVYRSIDAPRLKLVWMALVGVAIASPGLPMLAFDFGTLDTIMALFAVLQLVAVMRRAVCPPSAPMAQI